MSLISFIPDGTVSAVGHGVGVGISPEVNKFSNSRVLIRRTLFENGSDRLFTESLLERGGIRIVFKSFKVKEIGERVLIENVKIFKPPKGPAASLKRPQNLKLWSKEYLVRPQFEIFWTMPASRM
jgi:hypothetical protein